MLSQVSGGHTTASLWDHSTLPSAFGERVELLGVNLHVVQDSVACLCLGEVVRAVHLSSLSLYNNLVRPLERRKHAGKQPNSHTRCR